MISSINPVCVSYINSLKHKNPAGGVISFKGNADTFEADIKSVFGFIPDEEIKDIITKTSDKNKKKASGFTSDVFKINDFAVKIPKTIINGMPAGENDLGQNLKEFYALKEIEKINPDIAVKAHDAAEHKGIFILIEDFVSGIHPHEGKINSNNIKDLLPKFAQLDQNGIVNCDLQSGNIKILDDCKTKLIDFGSYKFLDNNGNILGSDEIHPDFFKKGSQLFRDINKPNKTKFMRTFFPPKYLGDIKSLADNPYLNVSSNTSNFEYRTMYKYLKDGKEQNPLEFFREYIKNKGNLYHGSMEEFLKSLNLDEVITENDTHESIQHAKTALQKAVGYEKTAKQVLSNPTDDILKTELGKIQIRTFLNPDALGSKIPNSQKIQSAYNQLVSLLEKNIASSDEQQKEYYTSTLTALKDRFKDYDFEPNQVDIPDDENLIKRLFEEVKTAVKPEDKVDDAVQTIKKTNKKLYTAIAVGIAIVGIGAGLLYKRNKKLKQPNLKLHSASASVPPSKHPSIQTAAQKPNIFAEFS
ncbi:MAG: hypothetical protein LUG16_08555 [Candidatus Gastranaerophilales bacterium]|nr:hypothetical protein [Candidatus Gastranaerophilales bacterium]